MVQIELASYKNRRHQSCTTTITVNENRTGFHIMNTNRRSVSRLSRYRSALYRFRSYDVKWVFSEQIASALGITAAQVRKDFSHFGVTGRRKIGYPVDQIIEHLNRLLGKNDRNRALLAGFGPLARAVYKEYLSREQDVQILAAFDESKGAASRTDEETGLAVLPISHLINFAAQNNVRFGIIALSNGLAQSALDLMVLAGVRGILNLSPVDLKSPRSCFVNTVNIVREFENVVFFAGKNSAKKRVADHA
jgi:redox-sensing transcriptional repressor